jgi:hypothetical protein
MRVAWVTHHLPQEVDSANPAHLPGKFIGGAEMTDAAMIEQAPEQYRVTMYGPNDWAQALSADRIVITGTDLLSDQAMIELADRKPLVWVHHQQIPGRVRAHLFTLADPFVTMSKQHSDLEARWSNVVSDWCHGHIDLERIIAKPKQNKALWAARNHPLKGLIPARIWAQRQGIELTEMYDQPRQIVLDAMAEHQWFVFLPKGFDACPRTLIEAEAAGCTIVTNDYAGRRDDGDFDEVMARQASKFWAWV